MRASYLSFAAGVLGLLISHGLLGQFVVASEIPMATTSSTQIALTHNLVVNSINADFSNATLTLAGTDQTLSNGTGGGAVLLGGLIVGLTGGTDNGIKSITGGAWEIARVLVFNDGVVVPDASAGGKIIHTLPSGVPGDVVVNNPDSYVNGTFYSKGLGSRFFPIGNTNGYFPAQLFNVMQGDLELGMRVIESNSSLSHGREILSVFENRYWELLDPSQSLVGPMVALSTAQTSDFIEPAVGTVLVGSSGRASGAGNLGGAQNGDFIVSSTGISATDRIFTLAKVNADQVVVKIRNVITPFLDNANDYLQIENIDVFPENKVVLLDRWGVKVKEWTNYSNVNGAANSSHDLSRVTTGNYICIVEYKDGDSTKELSQMVTIINQ